MKNIRQYIRNIFSIIVIFIYVFVMLFQNIPFINLISNVYAENASEKVNLVWIFVDANVYNKYKDKGISFYADYIQKTNKNTKAIVFPINTDNISSLDILKVINNLYFFWQKDKTSFLKSVVLIWNISLPVVNKDGFIYESIYPYVDIVKPQFVYSEKSWYFEYNWIPSNVELSHWIIKFDEIADYEKYFKKLENYSNNPGWFVDKKIYIDNFVSQSENFNKNMLKYYLNKLIFAENLVTKKITPLLLEYFNHQNNNLFDSTNWSDWSINQIWQQDTFTSLTTTWNWNLFWDLSWFSSMQNEYKDKISNYFKNMKDIFDKAKNINNEYTKTPTLMLESSLKNFFKNYIELFWNEYGSNLTDNLKATWRYDWTGTISSLNSIDIKDEISVNYLKQVNKILEQALDTKMEEKKYFLYYPLMTYYILWDHITCNEEKYENFYFWKNALNVNKLEDLHIYRWTFWNFTWIDVLKNIDSRWNKSNFSLMNNLFDTQTLSNRWYNTFLAEKDSNNYKDICWGINWVCQNLWKQSNNESVQNWAKRIYWWYSPLNINVVDIKNDPYNIKFNYPDYKQAWNPSYALEKNWTLFDLWGTIINKDKQYTWYIDTIASIKQYLSVFKTEYESDCIKKYTDWDNRTNWQYYDYLDDFSNVCKNNCEISLNWNNLIVKSYKDYLGVGYIQTINDITTNYKFIDTRIKHTNPTQEEFSWFNISTQARPVDSKNYVSFLWVWWDTIKFDYPNIFSVYVYKEQDWKLILKNPDEIYNTIKNYLTSIVKNYNTQLQDQLNKKNAYYNKYKNPFDNIKNSSNNNINYAYKPHDYELLEETFLIDKIWEAKISQIAEMLYYLNLWWSEKPNFSNLSWEIDYLYKSFDINEKISYIIKNYLDTENDKKIWNNDINKEQLNFPWKSSNWYEVGFIWSENLDDINNGNFNLNNIQNNLLQNYLLWQDNLPLDVDEQKTECWKPLWQAVILFQWPSALICRLQETLNKPFKIWSTWKCSMCSELNSNDNIFTEKNQEELNDEQSYQDQWKLEEYNNLKNFVDNQFSIKTNKSVYEYNDTTWYIQILNYSNVNEITNPISNIYVKSPEFTWNQFFINWNESTWIEWKWIKIKDTWKIPFSFYNLITGVEWKYYSYKAWKKIIYLTFCTKQEVCYTKEIFFDKSPWSLKYVEIKPFSDVMVYGWENPFVIRWFDNDNEIKYKNEINWTIYSYKLYIDPIIWYIKDWFGWNQKSLDYNFSSSSKFMSVVSDTEPLPNITGFSIKLKIDDTWKDIWWTGTIQSASKNIKIVKKDTLIKSEIYFTWNTQLLDKLPDDPNSLLSWDENYKTYNKNKLLKLHIEPKVYDKTLKTPLKIQDKNWNFVIWTFENATKTIQDKKIITYEKFVKQNDFLIIDDKWIDIYLLPTYKTWPYNIVVKIPWIKDYEFTWKISDFQLENIYVYLNKYQADIKEVVNWKIFGVDKFWNLQENLNWVSIIPSSWIIVETWDLNNIKVSWTKSWFITFKVDWWLQTTINFWINKTFLPIGWDWKIDIMYLTIFGYDWWKSVSHIMSKSSKNLAITTNLHDPKKLKKYDYIIKQNLKTNKQAQLLLENGKTILNFQDIQVIYSWNLFTDNLIEVVDKIENISSNWIFYVKEPTDDIIKTNDIKDDLLYINWSPVIKFNKNTQNSNIKILSNDNYGKSVYDIFLDNNKVGSIVFNKNVLFFNKLSLNKQVPTQLISATANSNWPKALWIAISDTPYEWISSSTKIDIQEDKWIWFRSNFRNITDFAAWLNVWDATKHFQNEFLINYGDPFIKRISEEDVIEQVWVSKTYGYRIYSDIAWWIQKVVPIDFNNDWLKDIAILYKNWSIRLLKHYKWEGNFEDLWNLMVLWKSVKDMFAQDYDWDWDWDLFINFQDGTLRVYKNLFWEFSVDPYPVCLDVAWADDIHFQVDQIFILDMNNDKKSDVIVNDLAWNVKVFFWPSYVSNSIYECTWIKLQQKLVKSYSYSITGENFMDEGYVYREWFEDNSSLLQNDIKNAFDKWNFDNISENSSITPDNYLSEVWQNNVIKFSTQNIPKVLWPSYVEITGDTIAFKKATFLTWSDPVDVYKTMKDLNWWNLQPWDKVKITLHFTNKENKKITYLESLKWPFAVISSGDKPILEFNDIPSSNVKIPLNYPEFLFQVDNYDKNFSISYDAYFQWSSSVKIKVDDFTKDNYGDIKVFLKNGCIKWYDFFKWKKWNIMWFDNEYVDLSQKLKDKNSSLNSNNTINKNIEDINSWNYENLLKEFKLNESNDIWWSNDFQKIMWSNIDLNFDIWPNVSNIKSKTQDVLNWLCGGIWFWKAGCWWITTPCNYAFLAPWIINSCGCPSWIDPWKPILWYPSTKWKSCKGNPCCIPIPVPNMNRLPSIDNPNAWWITPCPGVFPATFRLYISPTLTAWLWVAACFWPYKPAMKAPPAPLWAIAWNCIVSATDLPIPWCSKKDKNDADDELDDWMDDLDNGICSLLPVKTWKYPFSSIMIPDWWSFQNSNIYSSIWNINTINGLVNFEMNAHKINSLQDAKVLMEWWVPFKLNIETWTFKWIISCIIKKWLNKQIQFIINQLTQMTIYTTYPDTNWFFDWFEDKNWSKFNFYGTDLGKSLNDFGIWEENPNANNYAQKLASKYLPSKEGLKTLSKEFSNPFESVKNYFNDVPLINLYLKTIVIKVPWIWKDERESQVGYLENWVQEQEGIIEKMEYYKECMAWTCQTQACKQNCTSILNVKNFIKSVQKNIIILNKYKEFPWNLYKYTNELDYYLSQIACIIDKYVYMIVWWLNGNSKIFKKWVDAIIMMINIIRTWQLLIDVSLNWKTTCWKCRMDNWDLYDCTLSWLCIDLPVLPIPPFRIPDIFIDFSHVNLWIDMILPKIKIYPVPIWKFTLPDLSVPWVGMELPELPLLPEIPTLPGLPLLPAIPTLELTNLPPPPMIPELMPSIKAMLEVFKIVWYFRCIIKNGVWLVAEWNVKTRIEQLTARKNRISPFDFLNIDYPLLPFAWFDLRVDTYVKYELDFAQIYNTIKNISDSINKNTWQSISDMLENNLQIQHSIDNLPDGSSSDFHYNFQLNKEGFIYPKQNKKFTKTSVDNIIVNDKPIDVNIAKWILFDELSYLISEKNKDYMNSISNQIYEKAKKIQKDIVYNLKINPNIKWVYKMQEKVNEFIEDNKKYNQKVVNIIKDLQEGKKNDLNDDIFYKTWDINLVDFRKNNEQNITYNVNLFNIDEQSKSIIWNSQAPEISYLQMYEKSLNKFVEKTQAYKNSKPEKYYEYQNLENNATENLKTIKNILWEKIAYSSSNVSLDIIADPSQYIRWLYMEWTDQTYYNVLNDKQKAQKVRNNNTYIIEDMNNDITKDMIWYDQNSVYIKYSDDKPIIDNWTIFTDKYFYSNVIDNFANIVDKDWFITISGYNFKIWDEKYAVNDLKLKNTDADNLKLVWSNDKVNSYTIIYSSRIDILNDIEKQFNYSSNFTYKWNNYKKYAIIIYDKNLWSINETIASQINLDGIYGKVFIPIDFQDKDKLNFVIDKVKISLDKKWKYFKVHKSFLNVELNKLNLLSPYSNQEVWAEQIISDETEPSITITLKRINLQKNEINSNIVWTWNNLNWFVNTDYAIEWNWSDNVLIKNKYIADENYKFIKTWDSIQLTGFQELTKKVYYFIAEDYNWNIAKEKITLNIWIPDIKIDDINSQDGTISSSINHDMDNTAVKFGIQTSNWIKIIKNLNWKDIFTWGIFDFNFTWQIFNNKKEIIFYNPLPDSELWDNSIWSLDLTNWKIELKNDDYYILWDLSSWKLVYSIYKQEKQEKQDKKIFSFYLPPNSLNEDPSMDTTDNFGLKKINNNKLWIFSDWYCIYDKNSNNNCAIYISKKWVLYADNDYRNRFIVSYNNIYEKWISATFYDTSIPDLSSIKYAPKIFTLYYKVKDMSK